GSRITPAYNNVLKFRRLNGPRIVALEWRLGLHHLRRGYSRAVVWLTVLKRDVSSVRHLPECDPPTAPFALAAARHVSRPRPGMSFVPRVSCRTFSGS